MYRFEVCANSVTSCLAAEKGGAHRVELCSALELGGLTPSYGEIALAKEVLQLKIHVLIRPRGGDFLFNALEINSMIKDIEMCRELGVDGVVLGALTKEGYIDETLMRLFLDVSKGMSVTFHRAFDLCRNPQEALEQIIELGCDRILTSGQQASAEQGIPLLRSLQEQATNRIILLAGAGVRASNIRRIADETGITEFHFSATERFDSSMNHRNTSASMGDSNQSDDYRTTFTSTRLVEEIRASLNNLNQTK